MLLCGLYNNALTCLTNRKTYKYWFSLHKYLTQNLSCTFVFFRTYLVAQMVECLSTMREILVQSLSQEDPLEKGTAPHSSILAWRIPWTEEPGRLQSMGLQIVGHHWATNTFTFTCKVCGTFWAMHHEEQDALCIVVEFIEDKTNW